VRLFNFYAPSAFTPNGDGRNDVFRLVGQYRNINLNLYIYNRWGELVFSSDNMDTPWDGSSGGIPCPLETYVWIAKIKFPDQEIITKEDIVLKGTVILLR
jgi:gliding motility-associated-like protein